MPTVGLDAITSLLDEVETRINDQLSQATVLVDEVECVGGLVPFSRVEMERVRKLLAQTARLQLSISRHRATLAALRQQMRSPPGA